MASGCLSANRINRDSAECSIRKTRVYLLILVPRTVPESNGTDLSAISLRQQGLEHSPAAKERQFHSPSALGTWPKWTNFGLSQCHSFQCHSFQSGFSPVQTTVSHSGTVLSERFFRTVLFFDSNDCMSLWNRSSGSSDRATRGMARLPASTSGMRALRDGGEEIEVGKPQGLRGQNPLPQKSERPGFPGLALMYLSNERQKPLMFKCPPVTTLLVRLAFGVALPRIAALICAALEPGFSLA